MKCKQPPFYRLWIKASKLSKQFEQALAEKDKEIERLKEEKHDKDIMYQHEKAHVGLLERENEKLKNMLKGRCSEVINV